MRSSGVAIALSFVLALESSPARGSDERVRVDARAIAGTRPGGVVVLPLDGDGGMVGLEIRAARVLSSRLGVSILGAPANDPAGLAVVTVASGQVSAGVWSTACVFELTPTGRTLSGGFAECVRRRLDEGPLFECVGDAAIQPRIDHAPQVGRACDCPDDPSVIDVLCVHTALARSAAGGVGALQARVLNAIDTTTAVFSNSGVSDLSMNLVGLVEVSYDEVAPAWLDHLVRVTDPDDGFLDDVHALRDAYAADCVMLVIDDARFTGGAAWWAIWDQGQAFSCLNWRACGGGSLTPPHEWGHNLGCAHNREDDSFAPLEYSWGYHFNAGGVEYGDVMSYVGQTIPNFGNPNVLHLGVPTGATLSSALPSHAALAVSQTRWVLANHRDSSRLLDCNNNGVDDALDISSGNSEDANGNCRPDECEAREYVDAAGSGDAEGGSWARAHRDPVRPLTIAGLRCNNIREVWVADGTYTPDHGTGDRFASFDLATGVSILGGFQGQSRAGGGEASPSQRVPGAFPSILSGDIGSPGNASDNAYSVVSGYGVGSTAVIDGFTIEGGNTFGDGGGMYLSASGPTVCGCTIRANAAASSGAGAAVVGGGAPTFDRCVFEDNVAGWLGGGAGVFGSTATFSACEFRGNQAQYGGGLHASSNANADALACVFAGNHGAGGGGGIDVSYDTRLVAAECLFDSNTGDAGGAAKGFSGAVLEFEGCSFVDNSASTEGGAAHLTGSTLDLESCDLRSNLGANAGGAVLLWDSDATINNSLFIGNQATTGRGGGLWIDGGSTLSLTNSTASGNSASTRGGGVAQQSSTLNMTSTILWNNSDGVSGNPQDEQTYRYSGTRAVNYSCVQGLDGSLGGVKNIGADPRFADAPAGDLALAPGSPCIDAGDTLAIPPGIALDLASNPRRIDDPATADTGRGPAPVVDIGAYEFTPPPCPADMNGDGRLNVFDFLAFQSAFGSGDLAADFAPPFGVLNVFDFLAFQTAFGNGC